MLHIAPAKYVPNIWSKYKKIMWHVVTRFSQEGMYSLYLGCDNIVPNDCFISFIYTILSMTDLHSMTPPFLSFTSIAVFFFLFANSKGWVLCLGPSDTETQAFKNTEQKEAESNN